jgi:hypothetical protein
MQYTHQALAASGFAVIDSQVAMTMRPDIWNSGMVCAGEFAQKSTKNSLGGISGVMRMTARLSGLDRPVRVLTRSTDRLAERIEWVTGFVVDKLEPEQVATSQVAPAAIIPRRPNPNAIEFVAVTISTANLPRSCSVCDNLTHGGNCKEAVHQGEAPEWKPSANAPRLCLHYVPDHYTTSTTSDYSTGRELWPEVAGQPSHAVHVKMMPKPDAFLFTFLQGGPRSAADIVAAGGAEKISERTLQRAGDRLGVVKSKTGFNGGWEWALPVNKAAA